MNDDDPLPPAFFPVGLNLVGRRCVVIGAADDREAVEKERELRACGAEVRRLYDPSALRDEDVADAFLVILAPQDEASARRLRALADRYRFLLCCIDQPRYGFVAMQAVVKAGRARIAISTGGVAPRVGAILREALADALGERFARFLERLAERRRRAREELAESDARRAAMRAAASGFGLDVRVRYPRWFTDEEGN